jgi:hypothetical protein
VILMENTNVKQKPSISEFKQFIRNHPKLIEEVRQNRFSWQQLFEEWYLLGEEDEKWQRYKSNNNQEENGNEQTKSQFMSSILSMIKSMDVNEVQNHLANVSGALSNIQQVVQTLKPEKKQEDHQSNPFQFRKD